MLTDQEMVHFDIKGIQSQISIFEFGVHFASESEKIEYKSLLNIKSLLWHN